jgi:hypothetical protein
MKDLRLLGSAMQAYSISLPLSVSIAESLLSITFALVLLELE